MIKLLWIALGSALGGVMRFLIANSAHRLFNSYFPFGTLIVNVSGAFFIGVLFTLLIERSTILGPILPAFLMIGVLGGYTTFSTFSLETIVLIQEGRITMAIGNVLLSCVLSLTATWVGIMIGRWL